MDHDKYDPDDYERPPGHPAEMSFSEIAKHLLIGLVSIAVIIGSVALVFHLVPYGTADVPVTVSTLAPFPNDVPASVVEQHAVGSKGAVRVRSVSVSAQTHGFANPGGIELTFTLNGVVYAERTPETIITTADGTQIYEGWYDGGERIDGEIPFEQADRNDDGRVRFVFIAVGDDGNVLARSVAIVRYDSTN